MHVLLLGCTVKPLMDDDSRLFDCLCFKARLAARRLTAFYEARLAGHGLTITQFGLLAETGRKRRASIGELAALLEQDPSSLSRTLRVLEQDRLIAIAPDPANGRLRRVTLTPAGKAKLRAGAQAWREAQVKAAAIVRQAPVDEVLAATARLEG
jgi:DNA-binding MarR family transcriptional regulator